VILGAGLLVLVGVGLFVAGLATGVNALFWACVGVCVLAAFLVFLARRQLLRTAAAPAGPAGTETPAAKTRAAKVPATKAPAAKAPASTARTPNADTPEEADTTKEEVAKEEPVEAPSAEEGEPPVEEVEVTDLLLVVDLTDEVLVIDEHPRYHLAGCRWLTGRETIPLPLDEARTDGFTPCGTCEPDRRLAAQARARKAAKDS
jgi:hypothetical protein